MWTVRVTAPYLHTAALDQRIFRHFQSYVIETVKSVGHGRTEVSGTGSELKLMWSGVRITPSWDRLSIIQSFLLKSFKLALQLWGNSIFFMALRSVETCSAAWGHPVCRLALMGALVDNEPHVAGGAELHIFTPQSEHLLLLTSRLWENRPPDLLKLPESYLMCFFFFFWTFWTFWLVLTTSQRCVWWWTPPPMSYEYKHTHQNETGGRLFNDYFPLTWTHALHNTTNVFIGLK